jgi:hypothetical protein
VLVALVVAVGGFDEEPVEGAVGVVFGAVDGAGQEPLVAVWAAAEVDAEPPGDVAI